MGCQKKDWAHHKLTCLPKLTYGIVINCDVARELGSGELFEPIEIGADHPIHHGDGEVGPVSQIVGVPLVLYRHIRDPYLGMYRTVDAALDNQAATYLMINQMCQY